MKISNSGRTSISGKTKMNVKMSEDRPATKEEIDELHRIHQALAESKDTQPECDCLCHIDDSNQCCWCHKNICSDSLTPIPQKAMEPTDQKPIWEEAFMDCFTIFFDGKYEMVEGIDPEVLKLFISQVEKAAYERGKKAGLKEAVDIIEKGEEKTFI